MSLGGKKISFFLCSFNNCILLFLGKWIDGLLFFFNVKHELFFRPLFFMNIKWHSSSGYNFKEGRIPVCVNWVSKTLISKRIRYLRRRSVNKLDLKNYGIKRSASVYLANNGDFFHSWDTIIFMYLKHIHAYSLQNTSYLGLTWLRTEVPEAYTA